MTDNQDAELRELLDERDIEYAESQDRFRTRFRFNYCEACDDYLNEIEVMGACITASKSYLTPEQAIAATLGNARAERTCKREKHGRKMDGSWRMRCSECGYGIGDKRWNFCPNCGAKVVG
ncbi:MAG: zinc-ribbon domain-containing protein [Eggerthellaceae bacterium]|nr:zinc-ribbon domain-containing protein [Eggerthellaceae bacterium]